MRQTRAMKAADLLARIKRGPAFIDDGGKDFPHGEPMTREQMRRRWAIWAESWVTPVLVELIKELQPIVPTSEEIHARMAQDNHGNAARALRDLIDDAYGRVQSVPHDDAGLRLAGLK